MMIVAFWIALALFVLGLLGYVAACAGAQRWLTFREWWGCSTCRHDWRPIHHSYRCTRCGKVDREY